MTTYFINIRCTAGCPLASCSFNSVGLYISQSHVLCVVLLSLSELFVLYYYHCSELFVLYYYHCSELFELYYYHCSEPFVLYYHRSELFVLYYYHCSELSVLYYCHCSELFVLYYYHCSELVCLQILNHLILKHGGGRGWCRTLHVPSHHSGYHKLISCTLLPSNFCFHAHWFQQGHGQLPNIMV